MEHAFDNDQAITRPSLLGTAAEATYAGITSFMRRRYSRDLAGVDLVVSGVPFDTATTAPSPASTSTISFFNSF